MRRGFLMRGGAKMRQMMRGVLFCVSVTLVGLMIPQPASAHIVQNPGFETGDLTGWFTNPAPGGWVVFNGNSHSGNFYAGNQCVGPACIISDPSLVGAWLYQDLPTTPTALYNLSFFYFPGLRSGGEELQVRWNG